VANGKRFGMVGDGSYIPLREARKGSNMEGCSLYCGGLEADFIGIALSLVA
jgi:hypothetical protein